MAFTPMMIDLYDRHVVIVGGGKVALRRAKTLLKNDAVVTVISPKAVEDIVYLWTKGQLLWKEKYIESTDLKGAFLIIVATNDPIVNYNVINWAPEESLINAAADVEKGNVAFPSFFRRGDLSISVSTNGASPQFAVKMKKELECLYNEDYGDYVDFLSVCRQLIKESFLDRYQQKLLLKEILSEEFLDRERQRSFIESLNKNGKMIERVNQNDG
ncbi:MULTISPECIES: NAD(P)-binding protein [Oceanobacillus]|uniref:precorrin-2 dehydrogenase n=1 Tax=Oceanobacillus kimchii TaxID=746691 RepID=A0ABQ5TMG7_9BACI|nr:MULTISPECIES: NAD(P)-binding protein [Oceanobacillus]MBT2598590.1 NAD(P)-binding protein [Oceanobacillus sp. ISL-74]MBT2651508.1 NAD(P)-binding protein [Oceanobacillus sp. ISL-73]MCT1576167.1 NAD(P)-binding protein [Oceanobacillus kimchii]MCT2135804.1 NAD(P)-binding protein [Oceanobacillus kimchii]OEH55893.1 potassium transporter Trk [Oceanobacillus sp. E9]